MRTIFVTLLREQNKEVALRSAVLSGDAPGVFHVDPARFSQIPGSPFAYWADDEFVTLFRKLPPFTEDGRVTVTGMQTNDNTRWARLLWEEESEGEDNQLVPFAKGGSHSPFYFETYVGLRWGRDVRALKEWKLDELARGLITANNSRCWNEQYYFRPGITWPMRSKSFAPQPLPAGCIFSIRGSSAFVPEEELLETLAVFNSRPFDYIFKLSLGRFDFPEFITGTLAKIPWPMVPSMVGERLSALALQQWKLRRTLYASCEISPAFVLPRSLITLLGYPTRSAIDSQCASIQSEIDSLCCDLFGLGEGARREMELWLQTRHGSDDGGVVPEDIEDSDGTEGSQEEDDDDDWDLISWSIGVCFGRFDIRIALQARAIVLPSSPFAPIQKKSPGMMRHGDPVFMETDGVLVDDLGHSLDIVTAILGVMQRVGKDTPPVEELRDHLARQFFLSHLKMYSRNLRKAPIYWQLATPSASYSVWLYIHSFTRDTLFRVQNDLVGRKLAHEERRLESMTSDFHENPNATKRKRLAVQEVFVNELRVFLEEVKRVAPLWNPNLDDGVIINFASLWRLVPQHKTWQRELKATWDVLCRGKYDWAHLAMHLWPERVVPKCAKDRSLAIAHDLEHEFWYEDEKGSWDRKEVDPARVQELIRERTSSAVKTALHDLLSTPAPAGGTSRGRASTRASTSRARMQRATSEVEATPSKATAAPRASVRYADEATLETVKHAIAQVAGGASKADVLAATGLSPSEWNRAVATLLDRREVSKTGEKRGTRYHVASKPTS